MSTDAIVTAQTAELRARAESLIARRDFTGALGIASECDPLTELSIRRQVKTARAMCAIRRAELANSPEVVLAAALIRGDLW